MQAAAYSGVAVMGIKMGRGQVLQGLESQIIRSSDFLLWTVWSCWLILYVRKFSQGLPWWSSG